MFNLVNNINNCECLIYLSKCYCVDVEVKVDDYECKCSECNSDVVDFEVVGI